MRRLSWLVACALALAMIVGVTARSFANCGSCAKATGTIKAVDCEGKTITCTTKDGESQKESTVVVADDAKITINGNESKLSDLKAGDKVECEVEQKDGKTIAKVIAAKRE